MEYLLVAGVAAAVGWVFCDMKQDDEVYNSNRKWREANDALESKIYRLQDRIKELKRLAVENPAL